MDAMTATADPGAMALGGVLRAYAAEAKFESLRMLRTPGMAIPFLLMPVPVYLLFGVGHPCIGDRHRAADYLFSGWCAYAVMGPALFGPGCALAVEREAGLLRLKRALPAPTGSWLVAKMLMAIAFATISVTSVAVAALVAGKITLSGGQILALAAVMIVGSIPFGAISLCVGSYVSGSAAQGILNVLFLPMLWLSGLFFPLPGFLERWVVIWPAFHLNHLAIAAAGISKYQFIPPQMAAAVLLGLTVLFGGLAIRRLARIG
jgi:ABC-2 type transport system permease protein